MLGRLRHAVVRSQDVVLEVLVGLRVGRHVVGIETQAVRVKEFLVLPVVDDHLVGQRLQQGAVGARAAGNPLVANGLRRLMEVRIDEYDLCAARLLGIEEMPHVAAACRPCGVRPPEHDELGMPQRNAVLRVGNTRRPGPTHVARHDGEASLRRLAPGGKTASERIQDRASHQSAVELGLQFAQGKESPVAIGVADARQLGSYGVDGFVPADAFPFVGAAQLGMVVGTARLPMLALHGVLQTLHARDDAARAHALDAGPKLRIIDAVWMRVPRALTHDHAIDDIGLVVTPVCARAGRAVERDPLPSFQRIDRRRRFVRFLQRIVAACQPYCRNGTKRSGSLQKPPPVERRRFQTLKNSCHVLLLSLSLTRYLPRLRRALPQHDRR